MHDDHSTACRSWRARTVRRVALVTVLVSASTTLAACTDVPGSFVLRGSHTGEIEDQQAGAGGHDGAVGDTLDPEAAFRAFEPRLVSACGGCHRQYGVAAVPFLGDPDDHDPDPYVTISSWPRVLAADPRSSVLITWPQTGAHIGGPNPADLEADLLAWLELEAQALDTLPAAEPAPTLPAFQPRMGLNVVYLDSLGSELEDAALTFDAREIDASLLVLENIELHASSSHGIDMRHPLFSVGLPDAGGIALDPADSFSTVDVRVPPEGQVPLGPGMLILTVWTPGSDLIVAFERLAALSPSGDGGDGWGAQDGAGGQGGAGG